MKSLLKNIAANSFSLFLVAQAIEGLKIDGGLSALIMSGFILTLLSFTIRPILNIITFPFNIITLGAASILVNIAMLYLLTILNPAVQIRAFLFTGLSFAGFIVPKIYLTTFFSFALSSLLLSFTLSGLKWLIKE